MRNQIYKQRCFEAGSKNLSVAISKVRNHEGTFVFMIDSSEQIYNLLELKLPVFDTWQKAWNYLKKNYPNWHTFRPYFVHSEVHKTVLSDLKKEIREKSIASRRDWRGSVRRFWISTLKQDVQEIL